MTGHTRKRLRHLFGAFCVAALLAGTAGVTSAAATPQPTKATTQLPSEGCTGPQNPPGCV
jgi:hypothetical protein